MSCIIAKNGSTDYVVVLPENPTNFEKIASDLFVEYFSKSTGIDICVVNESSFKKGNFISIGNTKKLKEKSFINKFGLGGIAIKEDQGNLYIYGDGICDVIWAVQVFLEKAINYKFYAIDQVDFDKKDLLDLSGIDYEYTPTVPHRASGFGYAQQDYEYATGLKAYADYGFRADGTPFWGAWDDIYYSCHNHMKIMPLDKYYKDHPEWYNKEKTQLCLSDMQMRDEFFNNLIGILKQYDNQTHFILGHEDIADMCDCPRCAKLVSELKPGGLHLDFTNDMARRVEKWRKENCPDRVINVGMFAYSTTSSLIPPVKRVGDEIVPTVVAEPNVFVMFAPCGAREHNRPITDPANKFHLRCFEQWNKACKRFAIWMYYGSFRRSFEFADGIYTFKENIKKFQEYGIEYFFVQNNGVQHAISFQKLHLYVLTQLEWNVNQDTDCLIDEFMNGYYKCAAPYMKKAFDYLMAHMQKVRARHKYLTGREYHSGMCGRDVNYDGIWDLNVAYDISLMFDQADQAIENSDFSAEFKEQLKDRVEAERLLAIYIQLEYFVKELTIYDEARSINFFPKEKALELVDRMEKGCEKFNIVSLDGDGPYEDTLKKWRREIKFTSRGWEKLNVEDFWKMLDDLYEKYEV